MAADRHGGAFRQFGARGVDDALHVGDHAAEVAPLRGGQQVDRAADVVVRDHGRQGLRRHGRQTAEQLAVARRGDGHVAQRAERVHRVLRRLHGDGVGDAVLRIEPVGRRGLRRARQGRLQAVGGIAFRQADRAGHVAVEIDLQGRRAQLLLNARVGDAGDAADLRQQGEGVGVVRGVVLAGDLHVERCRRAEVQDLADHVRRQEGEGGAGEVARQPLAQHPRQGIAGVLALAHRDQHVAVEGADGAGVVVARVDAAGRQADVVDDAGDLLAREQLAKLRLDAADERRHLLDAGAGGRADMDAQGRRLDLGEEVATELRQQQE